MRRIRSMSYMYYYLGWKQRHRMFLLMPAIRSLLVSQPHKPQPAQRHHLGCSARFSAEVVLVPVTWV
jgi:hypothetical protein